MSRFFDINAYATNLIFLYEWSVYQQHRYENGQFTRTVDFRNLRTIAKTAKSFGANLGRTSLIHAGDELERWLGAVSSQSTVSGAQMGRLFSILSSLHAAWKGGDYRNILFSCDPIDDTEIKRICSILPVVEFDLNEAAECARFARYTAAVFHYSRAMEAALRQLLTRLRIRKAPPNATWQTLSDMLASFQRGLPAKTAKQIDKRRTLAEIVAYFSVAKIAWRNDVMHDGSRYSREQAGNISNSTFVALNHLVEWLQRK